MATMEQIWPPFGVRVVAGELELTIIREADFGELIDLVRSGVHEPGFMPFSVPWTDDDPAEMPANFVRYNWGVLGRFTPADFTLNFGVRRNGELIGTQGFSTSNFRVVRTGETGSWIAQRFQGRGLGTRMRQAVCAFVFDELDAVEITSAAYTDNHASLGVSRKVGYRENGTMRAARRSEPGEQVRLLLTPETFVRGDPIRVTGAADLRAFLEIGRPGEVS